MYLIPLLRRLSIKGKVILIIMVASVAVLILAASAFSLHEHSRARRSMVRDISALGRLIADRSTAALVFDDPGLCTENLAALRGIPSVLGAGIFREDGSLAAHYRMLEAPKVHLPDGMGSHRFEGGNLLVYEPIVLEGKVIGTVHIRSGLDELEVMSRQYLFSAFVILCLGSLVAFLLASWLQKVVSVPISHLTETARFIASDQDYSVRAINVFDDELGVLAKAFNGMLAQIQDRDRVLQESNERLESQVQSRTSDLFVAKDRAEAADRIKSAFLATMSHELRTPLNSIIGFTGILLQGLVGELNPEQKKQLGMVKGSANHLLDLINDVLDLSKIEAGQMMLSSERFDVALLVEKVVQATRPMADSKGIILEFHVAEDIPCIENDPRRAEQVLLNLLSNAIKFTERGSVQIDGLLDGGSVVLKVRDTGIGLKPEDMDRLFKPFSQIDMGLTRKYEGTGLGLSICKRLVELMGGEIRVESQPNVGSTFAFTLPVR